MLFSAFSKINVKTKKSEHKITPSIKQISIYRVSYKIVIWNLIKQH